ncbi:MAG: DMT family transporter [Candidatus Thorarchaeota archaeon]
MIGELLAIGSVLSFVTSNAIFKRIDTKVSPSQINAFRTIIGAITYIIIAAIIGKIGLIFSFPWQIWLWLILSFIFGQVIGDTAFFKAQEMLGTTIALSISMTFPIFTTIISLFLGIHIPLYFYGSLALIIAGVIVIGIGKNKEQKITIIRTQINEEQKDPEELTVGEQFQKQEIKNLNDLKNNEQTNQKSIKYLLLAIGIALVAALAWSGGVILTEKAINDVSNFLGTSDVSSLLGNVVRFPVAAGILSLMSIGNKKTKIKTWNKVTWILLFLGALIGTSLGAYLYTEAIFSVNAAFVSIIGSSSPIFSIPISWLINKEKINLIVLKGVLLTTVGLVLIFVLQLVLI